MSLQKESRIAASGLKRFLPAILATSGLGVFCYVESTRDAAILEQTVCTIVFVAAAVSSIAGFAFSAVASALLLHVVPDAVQVVQIMLVSSIALQSYSVLVLRRHIRLEALRPYLVGGLLTLPIGTYFLLYTPVSLYLASIGIFLVLYALYALLLQRSTAAASRWCRLPVQVLVGALGGITGPVAAFPGAFMTIWRGLQGWGKQEQRALYQPYILIMQIVTLTVLHAVTMQRQMPAWLIQYVPPALAGTYTGLRVFERLTTKQFNKIVNLFLLIAGAALIVKVL
jgi:uncharacterized membrane protein YfcA